MPSDAPLLLSVPTYAETVAHEFYPGQLAQDTQQDALRHMLAAGTLARKYGPEWAERLGRWHEYKTSPLAALKTALGVGQMPSDYAQDLHNNALGVALAQRAKSQEELETLAADLAEKAKLKQTEGLPWINKAEGGAVRGPTAEERKRLEELKQMLMKPAADAQRGYQREHNNEKYIPQNKSEAQEYSPLEMDYIIGNVISGQPDNNYAQGGVVTQQVKAPFNEFSMGYDVNPVEIGHAEGGLAGYGYRYGKDELKGKGYFGELPNKSGGVSTEISAEDDDIGDYPLIVPSLTKSELDSLLANERPSESIYQKARAHAIRRKAEGLSPYAGNQELRLPKPEGYAEGGSVESTHLPYDEAKISSLVNALREELHA